MAFILFYLTLFLATFSPISAVPVENKPRAVLPPSSDPFYVPPAGFENEKPGAILRHRTVETAFLGLIPNPVQAYQLLYRTTAINGSAIATVTTVFRPLLAQTDRFVSFHTAYDSSATICNPSYTYQQGAPQNDLISSYEMFILAAYLLEGYIVSSPDYEGPDAAFAAGRLEGMGVLDSMRAVTNFAGTLHFSTNSPVIVGVGYSGGAIATGWAASLHSSYAPELPMKGWVQGGTPSNLTGTLVFLDNKLFSGFLPPAIDGLSKPSAFGAEVKPIIDRIATPTGRSALEFAQSNCAVQNVFAFPEQSILSDKFQTLGAGLLEEPTIKSVLERNIMGVYPGETPTAPVFVYHATQDEIIPYANASTMVESWCANGASVTYTSYAAGGHLTTEIVAVPAAIKYVEAAFAGNVPSGCSSNTVLDNALNPLALGLNLEPVLVKLVDALAALGRNDSQLKSNLNVLKKTIQ